MWCDNLPRNRGWLSQVVSPYKLLINNHSVTFKRNPILINCSEEFTRNYGIFLKIKREKYKSLQTKSVTTSPGLPYSLSSKLTWYFSTYVTGIQCTCNVQIFPRPRRGARNVILRNLDVLVRWRAHTSNQFLIHTAVRCTRSIFCPEMNWTILLALIRRFHSFVKFSLHPLFAHLRFV